MQRRTSQVPPAEGSGGMEFYFPVSDMAFHWVRNGSLYSPAARQRQIIVKAMFCQQDVGTSSAVFDRFHMTYYFRKFRHFSPNTTEISRRPPFADRPA